jgi:glycosyltransferase involved in cell wall biosynthesis
VTGEITRGYDVDDFTAAVAKLARDPDLRRGMRDAAMKSVANRDWSDAARRFWAATL